MLKESIAIGMYTLNSELENAWKALFSLAALNNPSLRLPSTVLNTIDDEIISSDKIRLSHICGYPLVSQYAGQLEPLCAPYFDIEGVNKLFMEWEHDKHNDIMGYRNKSYKSLMTGNKAPAHHTPWLDELDDSYESYMKN